MSLNEVLFIFGLLWSILILARPIMYNTLDSRRYKTMQNEMDLLSDSLTDISLSDLYYAVHSNYSLDTQWLVLNVVSVLSNNSYEIKREFKDMTGDSIKQLKKQPEVGWTGKWSDVIKISSKLLNKPEKVIKNDCYNLLNKEYKEISIRLRYFDKKDPVFACSSYIKKDEFENCYMWDYNHKNQLVQVSQRMLKEQLMLWGSWKMDKYTFIK